MKNEKNYSVFFKDSGEEENSYMLSYDDAMKMAHEIEDEGYAVYVAKLENNQWQKVYETEEVLA